MERVQAQLEGSARWTHDKYEGPPRRKTHLQARGGGGKPAIAGFKLCETLPAQRF